MGNAVRVLIYGGCVSRDMFEYLGDGFTLIEYTARQSMISATTDPVALCSEPAMSSPFQRRMLLQDFASSMRSTIKEKADKTDLLVVDMIVERLGVLELPGGGYLTLSQELRDSGLREAISEDARVIEFGTREHFLLWKRAALEFVELLRQVGLLERTLLIEATFAEVSDDGTPARMWRETPASEWNHRYAPYYAVLKQAGIRTHTIGSAAIASTSHKWGPAAYHYVDDVYLGITSTVREMTGH